MHRAPAIHERVKIAVDGDFGILPDDLPCIIDAKSDGFGLRRRVLRSRVTPFA